MFQGTYVESFIKIESVTVAILLTLSLCGWVGGGCKVIFMSNPTVVLRLGWGFGNFSLMFIFNIGTQKGAIKVDYVPGKKMHTKDHFI